MCVYWEFYGIHAIGRALSEKWKKFAKRDGEKVMVNFVEEKEGKVHARVYCVFADRELMSCGTGTTAVGVCHAVWSSLMQSKVIQTPYVKLFGI